MAPDGGQAAELPARRCSLLDDLLTEIALDKYFRLLVWHKATLAVLPCVLTSPLRPHGKHHAGNQG